MAINHVLYVWFANKLACAYKESNAKHSMESFSSVSRSVQLVYYTVSGVNSKHQVCAIFRVEMCTIVEHFPNYQLCIVD